MIWYSDKIRTATAGNTQLNFGVKNHAQTTYCIDLVAANFMTNCLRGLGN